MGEGIRCAGSWRKNVILMVAKQPEDTGETRHCNGDSRASSSRCGLARSFSPAYAKHASFLPCCDVRVNVREPRCRRRTESRRRLDGRFEVRQLIRANTSNPPGQRGASPRCSRRASRRSASTSRSFRRRTRERRTSSRGSRATAARSPCCSPRTPTSWASSARSGRSIRSPAIIKDGHVYGRGAIDFKGGMAVFARAVMHAGRAQGAAGARRDLPRGSRRRRRAVQHQRGWRAITGRRSTRSSRSTRAAGSSRATTARCGT